MVAQRTKKSTGPKVTKSYKEINERIMKGQAVVLTAEEMIHLVDEKGAVKAAGQVDVVTTGTFGPMCSSGVFLNFGHPSPRIRAHRVWLNNVAAYGGIAAVDAYLGATELPEDDPLNKVFPGKFPYGGGHVIHDLVAGKEIELRALSYGTDCYPRKELTKPSSSTLEMDTRTTIALSICPTEPGTLTWAFYGPVAPMRTTAAPVS